VARPAAGHHGHRDGPGQSVAAVAVKERFEHAGIGGLVGGRREDGDVGGGDLAVSRVSSASDESNKADACSARSMTSGAGAPGLAGRGGTAPDGTEGAEGISAADKVRATARATPCVRDAGLGLPVTTAIRMSLAFVRLGILYNNSDRFSV
jgi:hypothetical protein